LKGAFGLRAEPTHQTAWAGALLAFLLFTALFIIGELEARNSILLYFRAVSLGLAVALFCVGWQMREREKDEPVFDLILSERERRLR